MPRKASPRIKLPSGVETSANGNYFYWKCNVTGKETFADKARFAAVVQNYGSESKLVKEYVLAPVKKYLNAGFDVDAIKGIMEANGGDLPKLEAKGKPTHTPKKKRGRKPKETALPAVVKDESGEVVSNEKYPWSSNPDYFKSVPTPMSIEETTKDSCAYPNRYLDVLCKGCSIYDQCAFNGKYSEKDWKGSKVRNEVVVKKLDSFS
jgi:hypothetical protein